jgi:hypothetical protein
VELALVLPVVVGLLIMVVQVGLLARDQVLVVHAARAAAREVAVDPGGAAARAALDGIDSGRFSLIVGGDTSPGGIATVTVTGRPTTMPLVGALVGSIELRERLSVRVEGP